MADSVKRIKNKINNSFLIVKEFYEKIVFKKSFFIPLLFFLILAYALSTFSRTISIDDLAGSLYTGEGNAMIAGYRWFFIVWRKIHSIANYAPFIGDFLALCLFFLSSVNLCVILYLIFKKEKPLLYLTFISLFMTYPLIHEVWEYTGTCTALYGSLFFSTSALIYMLVNKKEMTIVDYVFCGLFLTPSTSSYEASVFLYITIVLSILFSKIINDEETNWFMDGLSFAIPLFIAVINKFFIGKILIILYKVTYKSNGASTINWFSGNIKDSIYEIWKNINSYILSFPYFPVGEFVIALLLFCFYVLVKSSSNNCRNILPVGVLLLVSLFTQSLIQGYCLPYRTAQTVQYFVAFVSFLLFDYFSNLNRPYLNTVVTILFMFLAFRQSLFLNNMLQLNNQRSDNEAYIIRSIGYRLYSEFDLSKPVVFCGKYHLGNYIDSAKPAEVETDINSCINWGMVSFNNQKMMENYFSYFGFDIKTKDIYFDRQVKKEYEKIAKQNQMNPYDIKDMGDYILVYFGS